MPYSELYAHLVWATYERSALIDCDIEQALWALMLAAERIATMRR
jgi:hypothetical protein